MTNQRIHNREQNWNKIELFIDHIVEVLPHFKYAAQHDANMRMRLENLEEFIKEVRATSAELQEDERIIASRVHRIETLVQNLKWS